MALYLRDWASPVLFPFSCVVVHPGWDALPLSLLTGGTIRSQSV